MTPLRHFRVPWVGIKIPHQYNRALLCPERIEFIPHDPTPVISLVGEGIFEAIPAVDAHHLEIAPLRLLRFDRESLKSAHVIQVRMIFKRIANPVNRNVITRQQGDFGLYAFEIGLALECRSSQYLGPVLCGYQVEREVIIAGQFLEASNIRTLILEVLTCKFECGRIFV